MSVIYVVIRDEANVAMTSIAGPIRVFVRREGSGYDEQPVSLRFADACYYNLPLGRYGC